MIGCRPLTDLETEQVLEHLETLRDKTLFILGLYTGFRIQETLSLKYDDVFQQGKLVDRVTVKRCSMKNKLTSRSVVLHNTPKLYLNALIAQYNLLPGDYIFRSRKGNNKAMSRIQAYRTFKEAILKAGLSGKVALHSTRKTFANKVYNALDKDILKTSKALGHKNITSTISYLSFDTEEIDSVVKGL